MLSVPMNTPRMFRLGLLCVALAGGLPSKAQSDEAVQRIEPAWRLLNAEAGVAMAAMKATDRPAWWPDHVACRGMVVNFWGGGTYLLAGYEAKGRASIVAVEAPTSLNFFQAFWLLTSNGQQASAYLAPEVPVRWAKRNLSPDLLEGVLHAFRTKVRDPKYDNLMGPLALDPVTFHAEVAGENKSITFNAGANTFLLGDLKDLKEIPDARVQTAWGLGVLAGVIEPKDSLNWSWAGSTGPHLKGFALNLAVEAQDHDAIKKLLLNGEDPNARPSRYGSGVTDWEALSPLDLAAGNLDTESVKLLVKGGANAEGNDIYRPLDRAVLTGGYGPKGTHGFPNRATCLEIVQALLAAGANVAKTLGVFQEYEGSQRDPVVLKTLEVAAAKASN